MVDTGEIKKDDAKAQNFSFLQLLSSNNNFIRYNAWNILPALIEKGIITKEYFLRK